MKPTNVYLTTLKKNVKVHHSFKDVRNSQVFLLNQAKFAQEMDGKDIIKSQEQQIKSEDSMLKYIFNVLHLDKAQQDKVEANDMTDIQVDATRLAYSVQGYPKKTIDSVIDSMKSALNPENAINVTADEEPETEEKSETK